jgi:hypothetical protein
VMLVAVDVCGFSHSPPLAVVSMHHNPTLVLSNCTLKTVGHVGIDFMQLGPKASVRFINCDINIRGECLGTTSVMTVIRDDISADKKMSEAVVTRTSWVAEVFCKEISLFLSEWRPH